LNIPPKPGEITASALLLSILGRYGNMEEAELLALGKKRGLRGGALPLLTGANLLSATGLVAGVGILSITSSGRTCLKMLGSSEEPTDRFREILTALSFGTQEARLMLANVTVDRDGLLSDTRGIASTVFEHLAADGILESADDGSWKLPDLRPSLLLGALAATDVDQDDPADSNEIGQRGENLSMRYEFDRTGNWPVQVSRISNAFGYDLESTAGNGSTNRLGFEVKATLGSRLLIHWSANEARTALLLRDSYTMQIWAEVDLGMTVEEDYMRLTAKGYPRIVPNPGQVASDVVAHAATWQPLMGSRMAASNFVWEFWDYEP
jgi:hypothetical protein